MRDVAIIGTGYVGLTVGACMAHLGHRVHCIDSDGDKVARLNDGVVTILEDGLPELVADGLRSGRLSFTTQVQRAALAQVVFLCLPTPQSFDGDLDTSVLEAAVRNVAPHLVSGAVLVTKSTVPVGTHHRVRAWTGRSDVSVVSNPEFLREGTAVADFLFADRVVIGAADERSGGMVAELYYDVPSEIQRTDPASAELLKYAANAFLATKISFANEVSRLCDALGANVESVIDGIGSDPRIGRSFLKPGPGWGGSCFPKDTAALSYLARAAQVALPVVDGAIASNDRQVEHVLEKVIDALDRDVADSRIAVWGLTYKAGTDDCRDSPAIRIVEALVARGARVTAHDPAATIELGGALRTDDPYEPCIGADLLLVLTEWPEFRDYRFNLVQQLMHGDRVVDARNVLDPADVHGAGLSYTGLGRPAPRPLAHVLTA